MLRRTCIKQSGVTATALLLQDSLFAMSAENDVKKDKSRYYWLR